MDIPRASSTALAGDEQHWLPVAAIVVGQVHHVGTVLRIGGEVVFEGVVEVFGLGARGGVLAWVPLCRRGLLSRHWDWAFATAAAVPLGQHVGIGGLAE